MKVPRWVVGGIAIAAAANILWSAATPDLRRDNPEHLTQKELRDRRYLEEERQRVARARVRDGVNASVSEHGVAAEVRAADRAATAAARQAARDAAEREAAQVAAKAIVKGVR